MFKRARWMTMGTGVGLGLAMWGRRRVRAKVDRYRPGRVASELAGFVRRLRADVRAAAAEGRAAMDRREAELRGDPPRASPVPSER